MSPTRVAVERLLTLLAPGNGGSLDKCRRRWDLAEDEDLRYKFMYAFDRAMNHLDKVRECQ